MWDRVQRGHTDLPFESVRYGGIYLHFTVLFSALKADLGRPPSNALHATPMCHYLMALVLNRNSYERKESDIKRDSSFRKLGVE